MDRHAPLDTAKAFRSRHYEHTHSNGCGCNTLFCSGDVFYAWNGSAYEKVELREIRAKLYAWLDERVREVETNDGALREVPFDPKKSDVDQVIDALRSNAYTPLQSPAWLVPGDDRPDPSKLLVARNGIVDLTNPDVCIPPTPLLFTTNWLDYDYIPTAPKPAAWLQFLDSLWPDDPESIELLQDWFGYCLTGDTRQQKILMLIGPKRSGKGTIGRVLRGMLGESNVCAPTLAGLATHFGMWSLIGKLLAVISDARLSGRTDQAIVTERLLTISGEDAVDIDRKNMAPVTVRLPTRLMLCTNELPKLNDASGALASRFLVLQLEHSFYGREDTDLEGRVMAELPSILRWAMAGWHRLQDRGRFVQSTTGQSAIDDLNDLASPISAFVRDWCHVAPGHDVEVKDLYDAWAVWCREQGRDQPGTQQVFGRDLRAAVPGIATRQRGSGEDRVRLFEGIGLTDIADQTLSQARAQGDRLSKRYGNVA